MKVIITWDGDKIGRMVGRARLADEIEEVRRIGRSIEQGNKLMESWVVMHGGSLIEMGGDEGSAEILAEKLGELPKIRDQYAQTVQSTVSIGIGIKLSEADRALMVAKLRGGNQIVFYTPDIEPEIEEAQKKIENRSEADKLNEHYLSKADQVPMHEGANAGFSGASRPSPPTVAKPKAEASEHSQAEGLRSMVDDQPAPPEATHAAQDFEELFHDLAAEAEQPQEEQPQGPAADEQLKAQIVQVLQALKAQIPVLEQVRQSAPDTYAAVMAMAQAVIVMAKRLNGDPEHQTVKEIDDRARSEATVEIPLPPEEGEEEGGDSREESGDDAKKSEYFRNDLKKADEEITGPSVSSGPRPVYKGAEHVRQALDELHEEIDHRYNHIWHHAQQQGLPEDGIDTADHSSVPEHCGRCQSFPINQGEIGRCTSTAATIAKKLGGKVMGYSDAPGIGASLADCGGQGGHDFALIDGRYIADWWANSYHGLPDLHDMQDPAQQETIRRLYGDPSKWVSMYDFESDPAAAHPWESHDMFKAEPLGKMAMIHNDPNSPKFVYRIMNAHGDGPYQTDPEPMLEGDTSRHWSKKRRPSESINIDQQRPPPWAWWGSRDFTHAEERYNDEKGMMFGFETPYDAVEWFGDRNLSHMAGKGFVLHKVPASQVFRSHSGRQVMFVPHDSYDPAKAEVLSLKSIVSSPRTPKGFPTWEKDPVNDLPLESPPEAFVKKSEAEKTEDDWDCEEYGHCWGTDSVADFCLLCGGHEEELEKAGEGWSTDPDRAESARITWDQKFASVGERNSWSDVQQIPIAQLIHNNSHKDEASCDKHDDCTEHVAEIAGKLRSGSWAPVVVHPAGDGRYRVADGNHRVGAAILNGATHVPALVATMDLDKASLSPGATSAPPPTHHHLNLPVGSKEDPGPHARRRRAGRIKVKHPETGKEGWIEARAGQVMSRDGHPISARNPDGN